MIAQIAGTLPTTQSIDVDATHLNWMLEARCGSLSPEDADALFFPTNGLPEPGRALCDTCTVFYECFGYATVNRFKEGTFAGESGAERRRRLGIEQ